jgi:hypothetical protein
MREAATGDASKAVVPLGEALDVALAEGWEELAVHVGAELAATWLMAGDVEKAKETLGRLAASLDESPERTFRVDATAVLNARLAGAPADVLAALPEWARSPAGPGSVSAAGGAGGIGGKGGGRDVSKVGAALARHPKAKPLVTVARKEKGWEIRQGFDPKFRATQPRDDLVKHHADGGVTVSFHRWSVGLAMIDPTGLSGQPGEGSHRSLARAFYLVGKGETYALLKDATVTIQ